MAPLARYYRSGAKLMLGALDLSAVDLALRLYPSLGAVGLNVDAAGPVTVDDITDSFLTSIAIPVADRGWSWDVTTRTLVLTTANELSYTPGAAETLRYAVLYVDDATWLTGDVLALYDFLTGQALANGVAQPIDIRNLMEFRLFSSEQPAPFITDATPVRDVSPDGTVWRILTNGFGALVTVATSESAPAGLTYITAPDAATWALSVANDGTLSAVTGTPGTGDVTYAADEIVLPSTDPAERYSLAVSNAGILATSLL